MKGMFQYSPTAVPPVSRLHYIPTPGSFDFRLAAFPNIFLFLKTNNPYRLIIFVGISRLSAGLLACPSGLLLGWRLASEAVGDLSMWLSRLL
jgi:hypothetical protein